MTPFELLALVAAHLAGSGQHTIAGAVAGARELLDELQAQQPEEYAAHVRARIYAAQLRRLELDRKR